MGVGSSRNNRMFVVDRKARPTLERLDTSFNRTASQLKSILNEEIQLIKKIDPKDTRALSEALDKLIILRERSVMYRTRIKKMIPFTDSHRLAVKDLNRYLRRIRYHTSKIGRLLGKHNKKFNTYIEKLPQDIVPIRKRRRKYRKRFTKPITKGGLMKRVNKLPKTEGNAPYVEVVANVEPRNKEALLEMSQVVDELEERNKNVARPSRIQNNTERPSRNNTVVKMARVKSKEAIKKEEIRSEERVERNKLRLEREKLASEQREKDANRRSQAKIESQKILAADRERQNARDKEAANRRFQGEKERREMLAAERERIAVRDEKAANRRLQVAKERREMLAAERERIAVRDEKAANRRLELQKRRNEERATRAKDITERRLREKKLSLEEAKQKRLKSREERLKEKSRGQVVRPMEQRQRDSPMSRSMEQRQKDSPMSRSMEQRQRDSPMFRSMEQRQRDSPMFRTMEQRMPRESPMSQGSIPSQQIFVGSQSQSTQPNANSLEALKLKRKTNMDTLAFEKSKSQQEFKLKKAELLAKSKQEESQRKLQERQQREKLKSDERKKKENSKQKLAKLKSNERKKKMESSDATKGTKSKEKIALAEISAKKKSEMATINKDMKIALAEQKEKKNVRKDETLLKKRAFNESKRQQLRKEAKEDKKEKNEKAKEIKEEKNRKLKEQKEETKEFKDNVAKLLGAFTAFRKGEKIPNMKPNPVTNSKTTSNNTENNNGGTTNNNSGTGNGVIDANLKIQLDAIAALVDDKQVLDYVFGRRVLEPGVMKMSEKLYTSVAKLYIKSTAFEEEKVPAFRDEINTLSLEDLQGLRYYYKYYSVVNLKPVRYLYDPQSEIVKRIKSLYISKDRAKSIITRVLPSNKAIYGWYKTYVKNKSLENKSNKKGSWGPLPAEQFSEIRKKYEAMFERIIKGVSDLRQEYEKIRTGINVPFLTNTANMKNMIEKMPIPYVKKILGRTDTNNKIDVEYDNIEKYLLRKEIGIIQADMSCGSLSSQFETFMKTGKNVPDGTKNKNLVDPMFQNIKSFVEKTDIDGLMKLRDELSVIQYSNRQNTSNITSKERCILKAFLHKRLPSIPDLALQHESSYDDNIYWVKFKTRPNNSNILGYEILDKKIMKNYSEVDKWFEGNQFKIIAQIKEDFSNKSKNGWGWGLSVIGVSKNVLSDVNKFSSFLIRYYINKNVPSIEKIVTLYENKTKNMNSYKFGKQMTSFFTELDDWFDKQDLKTLVMIKKGDKKLLPEHPYTSAVVIKMINADLKTPGSTNSQLDWILSTMSSPLQLKHDSIRKKFVEFKAKYAKYESNQVYYRQIVANALGLRIDILKPPTLKSSKLSRIHTQQVSSKIRFKASTRASIGTPQSKSPAFVNGKIVALKISQVAIPGLSPSKLQKLSIPKTDRLSLTLPKTASIVIPKVRVMNLLSSTKRDLLGFPIPSGAEFFSINKHIIPVTPYVPIKLPSSTEPHTLSFFVRPPSLSASASLNLKVPQMSNENKSLIKSHLNQKPRKKSDEEIESERRSALLNNYLQQIENINAKIDRNEVKNVDEEIAALNKIKNEIQETNKSTTFDKQFERVMRKLQNIKRTNELIKQNVSIKELRNLSTELLANEKKENIQQYKYPLLKKIENKISEIAAVKKKLAANQKAKKKQELESETTKLLTKIGKKSNNANINTHVRNIDALIEKIRKETNLNNTIKSGLVGELEKKKKNLEAAKQKAKNKEALKTKTNELLTKIGKKSNNANINAHVRNIDALMNEIKGKTNINSAGLVEKLQTKKNKLEAAKQKALEMKKLETKTTELLKEIGNKFNEESMEKLNKQIEELKKETNAGELIKRLKTKKDEAMESAKQHFESKIKAINIRDTYVDVQTQIVQLRVDIRNSILPDVERNNFIERINKISENAEKFKEMSNLQSTEGKSFNKLQANKKTLESINTGGNKLLNGKKQLAMGGLNGVIKQMQSDLKNLEQKITLNKINEFETLVKNIYGRRKNDESFKNPLQKAKEMISEARGNKKLLNIDTTSMENNALGEHIDKLKTLKETYGDEEINTKLSELTETLSKRKEARNRYKVVGLEGPSNTRYVTIEEKKYLETGNGDKNLLKNQRKVIDGLIKKLQPLLDRFNELKEVKKKGIINKMKQKHGTKIRSPEERSTMKAKSFNKYKEMLEKEIYALTMEAFPKARSGKPGMKPQSQTKSNGENTNNEIEEDIEMGKKGKKPRKPGSTPVLAEPGTREMNLKLRRQRGKK